MATLEPREAAGQDGNIAGTLGKYPVVELVAQGRLVLAYPFSLDGEAEFAPPSVFFFFATCIGQVVLVKFS